MGLVEDLSAAFVAFTVEVDDAAEVRRGGKGKGLWLVSLAMYRNCMQWLPAEGMDEAELVAVARTPTDLNGMERWGYVTVEGGLVRPTRRGMRARQAWDGVPEEVEAQWKAGELREASVALVEELGPGLPDTMPIVKHGWTTLRNEDVEHGPGPVPVPELSLDSLLARPLTAVALEFEATGKLSLAIHANLLGQLSLEPTPLRDLPDRTGIHRAQIDNGVGFLERAGLAAVIPTPGAKRGKAATLTADGARAKESGTRKLARLEGVWAKRHGSALERVREALASVASTGLEHPPGTWRAESKPLARLPRFPLVTHRGGFPDGA
jgi:hypothetical protein